MIAVGIPELAVLIFVGGINLGTIFFLRFLYRLGARSKIKMTRRRAIVIAGSVAALSLVGIIMFWYVTPLLLLAQQLSAEFSTPVVNITLSTSLHKGGGRHLTIEVPSEAIGWVESRDQFACRMAAFARAHYKQPEALKSVQVVFSTVRQGAIAKVTTEDAAYRWQVADLDLSACKPGLSEAEKHFRAGAEVDAQGRSEGALTEYSEAIRSSPRYVMAYHNRGTVYNDLGQYQRAIEDFNEAIRLNPRIAIIYVGRGFSYDHLRQYERAIQDYDEAIRLDPKLTPVYYNRCASYNDLGQYQRAIKDCDEAIRLDPRMTLAYANRGNAYAGLGEFGRAIQDYNDAISLDPRNSLAYVNRGQTYAGLRQYERAIQDYDEAIRLNPQYAPAYAVRALAYTALGKHTEAEQNIDMAVKRGIDSSSLKEKVEELKKGR